MSDFDKAIAVVIGREPTADEVQRFYKVKEICGFGEHDSVWSMLLAFGHYEILYGEIPGKINKATIELLAEYRLSLEAAAQAAQRHVETSLIQTVSTTAKELADKALGVAESVILRDQRRRFLQAFGVSLGLTAFVLGIVIWFAFSSGVKTAAGEAAWLHTPEGIAAKQFSELNSVKLMMDCPFPFRVSKTEKGDIQCIPYDGKSKTVHGWRIK